MVGLTPSLGRRNQNEVRGAPIVEEARPAKLEGILVPLRKECQHKTVTVHLSLVAETRARRAIHGALCEPVVIEEKLTRDRMPEW